MSLKIEIVSAARGQIVTLDLKVAPGSTVASVLEASGLMADPEVAACVNAGRVGIFGKLTALSRIVDGDERIEIYRALSADPKEVRRARARTP
jgi:putative ubiquitin-RnfH superfamily antitoxin RatB of RatAB toxin-antitoxin module